MRNWKIGSKLLVFILSTTTLMLGLIIAININLSFNLASEMIDKETKELAYRYANQVKITLEEGMAVTKNLAIQINELKKSNSTNREQVSKILETTVRSNDFLPGAWAVFDPNTFDDRDKEFKNKVGSGPDGRFIPYWYQVGDSLTFRSVNGYDDTENVDWYKKAKDSGKDVFVEPYPNDLNGKKYILSGFSIPVKENGKVIGVIGTDILTSSFQDLVKNIKPGGTGFAVIVSNKGMIVAHPPVNGEEKVGTNLFELFEKTDKGKEKIDAIKNGELIITDGTNILTNEPAKVVYAPIKVDDTENPWSIGIVMPLTELDKVQNKMWFSVIIGVVILLILGSIISLLIHKIITKPLLQISGYASRIAEGDLNFPIEIEQRDEIGTLADSFRAVQDTSEDIAKLIGHIYEEYSKGNLKAKFKTDQFKGEWKELINNVFNTFNTIIVPVTESIRILSKIKDGDLRENMKIELEGDFNHLKDAVNSVHSGLLSIIDFSNKIANGDMNIDITKSSDDDQIYEWLVLMRDNIKHIVSEVNRFGEFSSKGAFDSIKIDTSGAKGVFADIFENLNKTVEAIKKPLSEVNYVMDRMANNDLTVKVEGDYEGLYKKMKESINGFANSNI
ncbi:MAG: hypothetical protein CSB16_02315 [Clostridiales bacterium]|nr:MAG: hypothetical protein CSB16_02315 [Clostridiales bacterium]